MIKYAVLIETSTYVPGDERSRTNPGHGYPAHTVKSTDFKEFDSKDHLIKWIEMQEKSVSPRKYKVIKFEEVTVNTKVVVDVE